MSNTFKCYHGSRQDIFSLPNPKIGEMAHEVNTDYYWVFTEKGWADASQAVQGNVQMNLYDMNKQILTQIPALENFDESVVLINEFANATNNTYHMLYGKEISYFTLFCKDLLNFEISNLGEAVIECLQNVGTIKSIDYTENKDAIEIWVQVEDDATCLYLFPYDNGIVKVGAV